ncbi:hypothetical protein JMJ35_002135 [Cladonia borealis]|uniref:Uncharacterized protein n=1 Tax=Cladonia borealis TaxID=184061 RepID=A0AA39UE20_9LECA|nr:hypothetical protein JMJ35_002135 [Cladonia borealis]
MNPTPTHELLVPQGPIVLPRVTIRFCTQCKWMLRAAYFAQELLSTFSTSLGEVSLVPSTGGVFTIDIVHAGSPSDPQTVSQEGRLTTQTSRLWDRKTEGGFPEVKHLKQLVRNIIDPTRDLGHVDRHNKPETTKQSGDTAPGKAAPSSTNDTDEKTIPIDPDASVARGPPAEEGESKAGGKETGCDDCK